VKDRDAISKQVKEYLTTGKEPTSPEAKELALQLTEFTKTLSETGYSPGELKLASPEDIATNMELISYYSKGIKPQDPKILKMIEDNEKDRSEEIEKEFLESDPD
jgi:glucosamine 6-phosphate synthetase-like amidotransferase/phosphosugar isomerase protein